MKSYRQGCPIAQSLDVLGDRWTLLVLRELLIQGPCRYTDLANGLPGIATSMLADRLRSLEEAGLITRELAPPPIATTLFHLTTAGRAVEPVLVALGQWGVENLDEPGPEADWRIHWFPFAASIFLRKDAPGHAPATIQMDTPVGSGVVEVSGTGVSSRVGTAASPDLTIAGTPSTIIGFLSGRMSMSEARAMGLTTRGDVGILRDFQLSSTS
jgi:DNA-binding HxlR family transcriptional regulator